MFALRARGSAAAGPGAGVGSRVHAGPDRSPRQARDASARGGWQARPGSGVVYTAIRITGLSSCKLTTLTTVTDDIRRPAGPQATPRPNCCPTNSLPSADGHARLPHTPLTSTVGLPPQTNFLTGHARFTCSRRCRHLGTSSQAPRHPDPVSNEKSQQCLSVPLCLLPSASSFPFPLCVCLCVCLCVSASSPRALPFNHFAPMPACRHGNVHNARSRPADRFLPQTRLHLQPEAGQRGRELDLGLRDADWHSGLQNAGGSTV